MAELKGDELILYGFKRIIEELKIIDEDLKKTQTLLALLRKDIYEISYEHRKSTANGGLEK
jgi:hypothetical protein